MSVLESFLSRHPWSERRLVEICFDRAALAAELRCSEVQRLRTGGSQERWARAGEPRYTLLRLSRTDAARLYLLNLLGPDSLWQGETPSISADAETNFQGSPVRVYVDPGGIAIEALDFLQHPPKEDASRIVLAADPARLELLSSWISRFWTGAPVTMDLAPSIQSWGRGIPSDSRTLKIHPRGDRSLRTKASRIPPPVASRPSGADLRWKNRLGEGWIVSGPALLGKLVLAGNCPLLTFSEWMLLEGDLDHRGRREWGQLAKLGLVEQHGDDKEPRWLLSSQGLAALSLLWNVSPESIKRFHPWPTKLNHRLAYSTGWLRLFGEHADLVRKLALSFVEGGLRYDSHLQITTHSTILFGSRIRYTDTQSSIAGATRFVAPDAALTLSVSNRDDQNTRPRRLDFFLEVDRATHALPRLKDRLDRYAEIWPALGGDGCKPVLFWATSGEKREEFLVNEMAERKIAGSACTFDRIALGPRADWWLGYPLVGRELPFASTGGFCPWRDCWRTTLHPSRQSPFSFISDSLFTHSRSH